MRRWLQPRWLLPLAFAVALLLRLEVAWGPLATLVRDATPDDAFYYFQIARNVASGAGPSLDGETPTNGFHPLWLGLLIPIYGVSDGLFAVRIALGLAALLGAISVLLVYAGLRSLGVRAPPALLASGAYALHPVVVRDAVNGLETSLAVAGQALTIWLFLRAAVRPGAFSSRSCLAIGLAAGATMLARTDSVFLLPPILLFGWLRDRGAGGLRSALLAGMAASLVVAPWLAWNLTQFGSIVQVSAGALPDQFRSDFIAQHGDSLAVLLGRSWDVTLRDLQRAVFFYVLPWRDGGLFVLAAIVALPTALLLIPNDPARARLRRQLALLMVPGSGIVLTLLVHTTVRWWTREWYYAPLGLLLTLGLGLLLDYGQTTLERRAGRAALMAGGAVALLLLAALGPHTRDRWGLRSDHRLNWLEAAYWVSAQTPDDARIGAFNAGILSYFSRRTVVNLDGAVNADARRARQAGHLMDYILEKRLDHVVDMRGEIPKIGCLESRAAECTHVATVGQRLPAMGGALVEVVRIRPRF